MQDSKMMDKSMYHVAYAEMMKVKFVSPIKSKIRLLTNVMCTVFVCLSAMASAHAETSHVTNAESGVQTWELHEQGVGFTLMQITPDQARGFFLARGFDREAVDYYASHCVFMTIVRNEAVPESITYNLANWRFYRKNAQPGKLKLKEDWLKEWRQRKVTETSLIAFEWSQHPTTQTFETGDWNQGMTTYAMPLGSLFNLKFQWSVNGAIHEAMLKDVQCAGETPGR
jgi:hypothetical protein